MISKSTTQGIFLTLLGIVLLGGGIFGASSVNLPSVLAIIIGTQIMVIGQAILTHKLFTHLHLDHLKKIHTATEAPRV